MQTNPQDYIIPSWIVFFYNKENHQKSFRNKEKSAELLYNISPPIWQ